jgi:hypothetical protein
MHPDDFEQKLERQTLRQAPSAWREEILATANSASRPAPHAPRPGFLSTLNHQLSTLLWPNQKAWACLAVAWLLIFTVNFSFRDKSDVIAKKSSPPSPELIMALQQQKHMLAELIGPQETSVAEPPRRFLPHPRSERRDEILNA